MNNLIPKKIHQIWIGQKELPEKYKNFSDGIKKLHGDFEYILWTDNTLTRDNFYNYDIIMRCKSFAQKADIMRYEILYKEGGVYIDIDFELYKNISNLLIRCLVLCNESVRGAKNYMANSFIACTKNNENLFKCVNNVKNIDFSEPINFATGPYYFKKNLDFKENRSMRAKGYKTRFLRGKESIYILPTHYLYPLHYSQKNKDFIVNSETYGVHHWDKNW
jgi:mannosyltransferase OCH1-like enzyme